MGFGDLTYALRVVPNTETTHNVIVCTLCSCYPVSLLGPSPGWYKSFAYRSRTVREPRAVLAEFGLTLPGEVEISVWDSTSEARYMVLPSRPAGTGGTRRRRARRAGHQERADRDRPGLSTSKHRSRPLARARATADLARTSGGWVNARRRYSLAWPALPAGHPGAGAQQAAGNHGDPVPERGLGERAAVGGRLGGAPRG